MSHSTIPSSGWRDFLDGNRLEVLNLDGMRNVRLLEHFYGNASFPPRRGGLQQVRAQLHEKQAGLFRLRMPVGNISKTTKFLHQLH